MVSHANSSTWHVRAAVHCIIGASKTFSNLVSTQRECGVDDSAIGIGQLIDCQSAQQLPMLCQRRSIRDQPLPLRCSHTIAAKCVLSHESRPLEFCLHLRERLEC